MVNRRAKCFRCGEKWDSHKLLDTCPECETTVNVSVNSI